MKGLFFGWYIVAASLILNTFNGAMFAYGFTAFVNPIAATFGWGLAQIALASSLRSLETGALQPFVGAAIDRWPSRRLMLIAICIFVLGVIVISQTTNLVTFYAGFLIVGLGGAASINTVPTTVVARWFKKNIGKASGIQATGMALGGVFAPLMVRAIDAYGWQTSLVYLAIAMLIMGIPLSFLFRDRPEKYGLLPDGISQEDDAKSTRTYDPNIGIKDALKTRAFWYLGITLMVQMTAVNSVSLHLMPYLTSIGMVRATAALGVMAFSIVNLSARIPVGILADTFKKKYIMAFSMGALTLGLVILEFLNSSSFVIVVVFAIIYGIGACAVHPARVPILREYFGTKKFGTLLGLTSIFGTVGSMVGAPVAGWVFDTRGTYEPIWLIFAGLAMVGTILMLILSPPPTPESEKGL